MSDSTKVVLVTGAAGGLGRALVKQFAAGGWRVFAASRQPAEWGSMQSVERLTMDVLNVTQVTAGVESIIANSGRIDCVVSNAGVTCDGLSWMTSDPDWDRVLDVNLTGAFRVARAVARQMARQRDGQIIHISSFAGRAGSRGQATYAAAKAGLFGLTQSLAKELGSRNLRVNAVLPGVLPTGMTAKLSPSQMEEFAQANALGRINSLGEVARFIEFLAGTENISGQLFQLDSRITPWG